MSTKTKRVTEQTNGDILHEQISLRAYQLWQERGCPIGSPEEDWSRAEEEIRRLQAAQPATRSKGTKTRSRAASA
jgi:hypothetical protein